MRDLGADVVPINFLNAIEGTPIREKTPPLTPMQAMQIIAVFRFILPDRELKIAGGREKILRDMPSWIFFAGGYKPNPDQWGNDPLGEHFSFLDFDQSSSTPA